MDTLAYVHFPFCLSKCPYCDFASVATPRSEVPADAYARAVLSELRERAPALEGRRLGSVFFGGGTPSLWDTGNVGRVLAAIRASFGMESPDLEVNLECNPTSLNDSVASALADVGVTRVSVGVQSFSDDVLRSLGRLHDGNGATRAVEAAVRRLPRVSADLIFGAPGQSVHSSVADARRLLDLGLRHVSAYSLTVEDGTPFAESVRAGTLRVSDRVCAEAYRALEEVLEGATLAHYEVSSYAVPGEEARHNLGYWRGRPYLGLGAAAVGCLDDGPGRAVRWRNEPDPRRYLESGGVVEREHLGPSEIIREALMLGLRTAEGVDLAATRARAGRDPLDGRERALERRCATGDVVVEGERLRVPRSRWLHLDAVIADLF